MQCMKLAQSMAGCHQITMSVVRASMGKTLQTLSCLAEKTKILALFSLALVFWMGNNVELRKVELTVTLIDYLGSLQRHEEQSCVLSLSKVSRNRQNIPRKSFTEIKLKFQILNVN
ncbi:hypothetical protein E2542_SST01970 [Spatholobus suberectus]|nr:hypothetical protein E2542_SST01970 [Spatholobus suberectus]